MLQAEGYLRLRVSRAWASKAGQTLWDSVREAMWAPRLPVSSTLVAAPVSSVRYLVS